MARGIDTKCIHLEEDEGQCSHYGAPLATRFIRPQRMRIRA